MPTIEQRHRQTDGQTDGRLTIAIPRFALRASRGKKADSVVQNTRFVTTAMLALIDVKNINLQIKKHKKHVFFHFYIKKL